MLPSATSLDCWQNFKAAVILCRALASQTASLAEAQKARSGRSTGSAARRQRLRGCPGRGGAPDG